MIILVIILAVFKSVVEAYGINPNPTAVKPKSSLNCGIKHLTMREMPRTAKFTGLNSKEEINTILQSKWYGLEILSGL